MSKPDMSEMLKKTAEDLFPVYHYSNAKYLILYIRVPVGIEPDDAFGFMHWDTIALFAANKLAKELTETKLEADPTVKAIKVIEVEDTYRLDLNLGITKQRALLKELTVQHEKLLGLLKYHPVLEEMNEQIKVLKDKRDCLREDLQKQATGELKASCLNLLEQCIQEAEVKKGAKSMLLLPKKIEDWFKGYCSGKEGSDKWKIKWICPNSRYVIIHHPGGTGWSGRGAQSYYPSYCYLCDTEDEYQIGAIGYKKLHEFPEGMRFGAKMIAEAEEVIRKAKNEFFQNNC